MKEKPAADQKRIIFYQVAVLAWQWWLKGDKRVHLSGTQITQLLPLPLKAIRRTRLPISITNSFLSRVSPEFRSCVKVEVAVLGSPSLIVLMVSVDVEQQWTELGSGFIIIMNDTFHWALSTQD